MSEFVALFTTSTRTKGRNGTFGSFYGLMFFLTLGLLLSPFLTLMAQEPLNQHTNIELEKKLFLLQYPFSANRDYIFITKDSFDFPENSKRKFWFTKKLCDEDLAIVNHKNYYIAVNPLINYQKMYSSNTAVNYYQNTRGIQIKFLLRNSIAFQSVFYENQALFPDYINAYMQQHLVAPGQGATKIFKETQHDFSQSQAVFLARIGNNIVVHFGHGKNFIGNGYRSMLLSDASFSYPFIKINYTKRHWQYSAIWTEYNQFYYKYYAKHYKKNAAIQLLSYSPVSSLNFLFFQSINYKTMNNEGRTYPWPLFIPLPLAQIAFYGLENENNALLGLNAEWLIKSYVKIYSQIAIDGYDKTQTAYQAGFFIPDITNNRINKLQISFRVEFNQAFENIYDSEDSIQTYNHYNEALAHPLGNNFSEFLIHSIIDYRNLRFTFLYNSYLAKNKPISLLYTYKQFPDVDESTSNTRAEIAYIFNKKTNLQYFGGYYIHRSTGYENTKYFSVGLKTSISNNYYAF
jgi:hypothetical protein